MLDCPHAWLNSLRSLARAPVYGPEDFAEGWPQWKSLAPIELVVVLQLALELLRWEATGCNAISFMGDMMAEVK